MPDPRRRGARILWALTLATVLAQAADATLAGERFSSAGMSQAEVQSFLANLQSALQKSDPAGVAAVTHFPLMVNGRPGPRNTTQFVREFSTIFNGRVRNAVLAARLDTLFPSHRGVMIGSGSLLFTALCEPQTSSGRCDGRRSIAIIAVNNRGLKAETLR